jgi:hypothetical protein
VFSIDTLLEVPPGHSSGDTFIAGTDFGSRPRPFRFADAMCKPLIPVHVLT